LEIRYKVNIDQTTSVRVFAPASVANVAVGYDILGFALNGPGDEIVAGFSDRRGLEIRQITGDSGKLPYTPERNTAGFAALKLLEYLDYTDRGIFLEIHKKMPFGSGLGSSAASAAGAVMAVNELLGCPLDKPALLPFAVLGEQIADGAYHADNVAPSLLGGIVLVRNNATLDVHALPVPEKLYAAVVYPEVEILTREARSILSREVSLEKLVEQSGNLAGFIVGLYQSDYALIGRSLQDTVIEPQRARLIPCFYAVKSAALEKGALGCSISGAGPSIFALCDDPVTAKTIGMAMGKVFEAEQIRHHLFLSGINLAGAKRIDTSSSTLI
jgi:homoserine kinase